MTRPTGPRPRRLAVTVVAVLAVPLVLTGCSGGADHSGDSAGGAQPRARSLSDEGGGALSSQGDSSKTGQRTSARVIPDGRDIVYTGQVTVRVREVSAAVARVEGMTLGVDGVVFDEQTAALAGGRRLGEAHLTLRVPPSEFGPMLDRIGDLGRELSRNRTAKDVTTEVADTGSRVRSQERSVARVRALLGEAETIGEVVQIEAELARREADLESLQAQLARLEDVTDMATIDVTLLAREAPAPRPVDEDELGFLAGLEGGWAAFVGIVLVGLTIVGAMLPFAMVAALVGVPAYLLLRTRRRQVTTSADA